jgi:hypothetical protein
METKNAQDRFDFNPVRRRAGRPAGRNARHGRAGRGEEDDLPADGWVRCHYRTCAPQYDKCGSGRAGLVADKPKNPGATAKGPHSQRVTSGPFVPKDRNPTGGIVPGSRNPTGGIVPGGHVKRFGRH